MAPASLSTSGSTRLSQFGLYRSIDARTEEFMKLSRKRQLRQGCACAAVSTIVTVTVVIVVILVYLHSMNTLELAVVRNRRPQKLEKINNAQDENAMNMISKHGANKHKRARVNFHSKERLIKNTEAPPALTDIEQFSKIKNTLPSIRHLMKVANRTFPIEYKLPHIYYSKSLKSRVDKIRRFKPLLADETKTFREGNTHNPLNHNIFKNKDTDYNLYIETKSTTERSVMYLVKTKDKVENSTSNNKTLHTDKHIYQNLNKNVKTQFVASASDVNKKQNSKENILTHEKIKKRKKGLRHVNGTLKLQTDSSSNLNTTIENQITKFVKETDLCNNKDLLRNILDKLISICKKDKTKSKCKMACCNKNKTLSEKPIIKTNVTVNAQSTYTSNPITTTNIPTTPTFTTTKYPFVKYFNYVTEDIYYDYVSTKTTTMAPGEKSQHTIATRKLATLINSHEDTLAKNQSMQDLANIQSNIHLFKITNDFSRRNNRLKYPTKPISDIISSQANQGGQNIQVGQNIQGNQIRNLLNNQEVTTTTELTVTTNSNNLTFAPTLQFDEKTDDSDKKNKEDSMKESASSGINDNIIPQKDKHQAFVKAIKSSTVALENEKTYENRNNYNYSRPPAQSVFFYNNKMNESENMQSEHEVNHRTNKHDFFQPYQTIQTNTKKYTNFDSTVLKYDDDDDDKNQKYKATANILKLDHSNSYPNTIKSMKSLVKDETVTEDLSTINTTGSHLVKNTKVVMDRLADELINHKVNEIKSTAMFTTEAVGIHLSRQTPSVLSQDMETNAIQKSNDMSDLPINYILDKEVLDEVRDQNITKKIQLDLKNLGFYVVPSVKDKKVFENISSDNVMMNITDVMSKKLRVSCFIHNPDKTKVQSVSSINSNDMGAQIKDNVLFSSHGNININNDKISEELFNLLHTTGIDDYIQNETESKISSGNINEAGSTSMTQPIERNEPNILTDIKHVMSSENERESTEVLGTTTQLTINSESAESSKEIEITSKSYTQKTSVSLNVPWYRKEFLDAQMINQLLQTPRPYFEEYEDTTQSTVFPETSTYTQILNKVCQNCQVPERKMRTVERVENLSESPKKIEGDNIKKILQPQKSYSQYFEIKPLHGTTNQRHQQQQAVRVCGNLCKVSEESANILDSHETLEDLDVDALIIRQHTDWIKKKRVELNQIIKPEQSYRLTAGLPSYLEIVRNDFSNSNSIN